jgi:hypothetical protein
LRRWQGGPSRPRGIVQQKLQSEDGEDAIVFEQLITCGGDEDVVQQVNRHGQPKGSRNLVLQSVPWRMRLQRPLQRHSQVHNHRLIAPLLIRLLMSITLSLFEILIFSHCGLEQATQPANLLVDYLIVALKNP